MRKIRFTYTSTEIEPSVFLLLFFRMVGIYVYERFLDSTDEDQRELLQVLDEGSARNRVVWDDFDLDLYYVQSHKELAAARRLLEENSSKKELFIVPVNTLNELSADLSTSVTYTKSDNAFLKDLLRAIYNLEIIDESMRDQLISCSTIYCSNLVWQLTLKSKFFYKAEDEAAFLQFKDQYRKVVNELRHQLFSTGSGWGKEDSFYIQYSILNLAFEGNQYCYKNRKPMWYSSRQLADICKLLLNTAAIAKKMYCGLNLLLAQIYTDLLNDPNAAYQYFGSACEEYNAYVYFKIGCYWQDYARDYVKALKNYSRSVLIYPEYYRAWYRMGNCYMETERCEKAIDVFQNVAKILEPRRNKNCLRPMEIEYLFKAHNQCAYVWNKIFRRTTNSLQENYKALEAWDVIKDSIFFDKILGEKDPEGSIRTRTQNELNIYKIYYEIAKLNEK